MNMSLLALVAALTVGLNVHAAHAAEGHSHGTGSVEVSIDGGQISIALELPLDSAVGFERAPKTDKEKTALADAAKLLNDAQAVFIPTANAKCAIVSAQASVPHTAGTPAPTDGHADIDASYVFRCTDPAALKGIETTLFKHFKRLYRLEARRIGPTGQGSMRLSAKQPTLSW